MNEDNEYMAEYKRIKSCPKCGGTYIGFPAISRLDNETPICPDCGTREALTIFGVDPEEQERLIASAHQNMGREKES